MSKNFKFVSFLLSLMLCFSAVAFGQQTTGEIQGTVKDPQGANVPNATITLVGTDVGFRREFQTDDDGYFRAREIPAGLYTVSIATISGFQAQERTNIQVTSGVATTVNFELAIGTGVNVVDVLSDDNSTAIDTTDTKVQETITAREIDNLPKGVNITSLLRTTAATRAEPLTGGFQINGGSGSENSFIIDGQEVSNFRTGVLNGNNDLPFQFIQEVQVKSSGFEAEFGGATGGVVNIITKSGTNDLRGEFGIQFNTSKLNAGPRDVLSNFTTQTGTNGQFVENLPQQRDRQLNRFPVASLGGAIIKDKLWFYGIYAPQYFSARRETSFFAFDAAGTSRALITDANLPVFLRGRGISPIQDARSRQTNEYAFIKLDSNPTNSLRVSTSFTYNPIIQEGLFLGVTTAITTPSYLQTGPNDFLVGSDLAALQGGRQNANNFRVEGIYTPNSNLTSTLRYTRGFLNEKLGAYFVPNTQRISCTQLTGGITPAQTGCVQGFQNTNNNNQVNKDVSIRNTFDADLSYFVSSFGGRHEFKGGYQYNKISNDVDRGYDRTGRIALYYGRTTFPVCFGAFALPTTITPRAGSQGVGCLLRIGTLGKASNENQALYIQDKYQPFNRLTINLGVRTERENLPSFNGQNTGLKFDFQDKIAPRLGAAFDVTGDGKTKISAFYGWFYDRLKFELPRGSFGGDFYRVDFFDIPAGGSLAFDSFPISRIIGSFGDPIGGGCPAGGLNGPYLTRCQIDYRVPSNIPNLVLSGGAPLQAGAVDPNLKPFRQSEFTIEMQREVMRQSVVRARYLFRNVDNAVEDAGFVTPEGSEFYIIANPGEGLYAQRAKELGFNEVAKAQRRYDAFQVEFDTRFIRNFNLNVNYTLSRLYGNYSGLANSDENGRTSPGVNRNFDLPFVGFTASGDPDNGRLATDRPHVFKASGTYSFDFGGTANSTDLSFFTTAQSGTPLTSFVDVFNIFIPETRRGNLGRTEKFTQTDLSLTHRYRFGRDERYTVAFDVNVLNVLNENNILGTDTNRSSVFFNLGQEVVASGSSSTTQFRDAVNILTSRGVTSFLNSEIASDPFNTNASFNRPNAFQAPRSVRFGFRFLF